ncbi:MAG: hypothetical protein QF840_12695 [Pseudomonadales bacterium]|nr:hypothetical protein [Pseudomonadales bacterium]
MSYRVRHPGLGQGSIPGVIRDAWIPDKYWCTFRNDRNMTVTGEKSTIAAPNPGTYTTFYTGEQQHERRPTQSHRTEGLQGSSLSD